MPLRMSKGGTVQLTDPRADEARPATIMMIAIAAGGLGVLLMLGLARVVGGDESRTVHQVFPQAARADLRAAGRPVEETSIHAATAPRSPRPKPGPAVASIGVPAAAKSPQPALPAPSPVSPVTSAAIPTSGLVARPSAPEAGPEPARAIAASKRRVKPMFERGVVAYVRCEHSEQRHVTPPRFPCPRDRKLEEYVWRTLAQLVDCTDADPGRGSAELRLTLQKSRALAPEFRSSAGGPSLNLRAVSKCSGAKLANARTSLRGPHALVSFRFGLK